MKMSRFREILTAFIFAILIATVFAPTTELIAQVSFQDDIFPILQANCNFPGCHGSDPPSGLLLTTFDNLKKGGRSGTPFIPNNSAGSLIVRRIDGGGMPRGRAPLKPEEIQLIKDWIDQGGLETPPFQPAVVINEVDYQVNDRIELKNVSEATVDIGDWVFCSLKRYSSAIRTLEIVEGSTNLEPGATIVISGFRLENTADLGLYRRSGFSNPANIESFVQWGASVGNSGRESVAVQKGIWTVGDFVLGVAEGHSIEYDGEGFSSSDWFDQASPTLGDVTLEVVGSDSLSTSAPIAGVTYELAVTNGTNQQGTVNLVPFPELGIEGTVLGTLSSSSFDLAPGQSATVLLEVTGDAFTEPGIYEVTVTATLRETSAEVKTTTTVTIPTTFGVALVVEGKDDSTIEDVVAGAPYTLIVTNTGNQPDTITLEADPSVGIEGTMGGTVNPTSVELEPGTAETIILNVIGDAATQAGTYDVKVIATSTGDSTQTAEAVTHTTVDLPVVDETPWDVNKDGTVNIFDLVIVSGDFGKTEPGLQGDVDGNGTVNIFDLVLVARHFGEDTSVPAAAPAAR